MKLTDPGNTIWDMLPAIAGISAPLVKASSFTIEAQADTWWRGALVYHRPDALPTHRYLAFLGGGRKSDFHLSAVLFGVNLLAIKDRVERNEYFNIELQKSVETHRFLNHPDGYWSSRHLWVDMEHLDPKDLPDKPAGPDEPQSIFT